MASECYLQFVFDRSDIQHEFSLSGIYWFHLQQAIPLCYSVPPKKTRRKRVFLLTDELLTLRFMGSM
jgi:hypothetical protein